MTENKLTKIRLLSNLEDMRDDAIDFWSLHAEGVGFSAEKIKKEIKEISKTYKQTVEVINK